MKCAVCLFVFLNIIYLASAITNSTIETKKVSTLNQDEAETGLFLLVAVCFVLLLAVIILLANYLGVKSQLKKLQEKQAISVA